MVKFTYARFFFFERETYFLHMGFIHYLFGKTSAPRSSFFTVYFSCSFAEVLYVSSLVCSKVQIVTRIAQSAQVQQIMMYRRSHIAISPSPPNLPPRGLTKRRKSIVCLCIDQLRLIESWTVRDLRNDVILLSHL